MKGWAIMVEKNFSRGKKALSLRLETFFQRSENRGRKDARAYGWRESLENIYQMHVYIINNLFGKCEIREVEKYDVSGLFED